MKAHRHRIGTGRATVTPPQESQASLPADGIPLLLLPERVVFQVDATLLRAMEGPSDDGPDPGGAVAKRIATALKRMWFRQWEV